MIKYPTTSPDIGTCRTYISDSTVPWRWVLILSSGHEIRTDSLPVWMDGKAEVTDAEGKVWTLCKNSVIAYRRGGT